MLSLAADELGERGEDGVALRLVDALSDEVEGARDLVLCVRLLHHVREDAAARRALDLLCGSASRALIFTAATRSTLKGFLRDLRARPGLRRKGERIRSLAWLRRSLRERGFEIAAVRRVDPLFSSQTWILALPRPV